MDIIKINNLTKRYNKNRGIEDISFEVKENEIFGFIGPNGAGKSTTIRTMLNLIKADAGSVTIFNQDAFKDHASICENIGYLPSEVFYYDNMKVKDLLNYSASFYKKDCTSRIKELAHLLDLDTNKKIDDLSLGNKKKVGIVQGLLHSPKLIILDEPTSGLDPLMQQKFFDLLKQERDNGATILFSSHILSEVQKLCDRVAIIKEGKIIRVDTISALLDTSYKKVTIKSNQQINFDQIDKANLKHENNQYSLLFKGDINQLIQLLAHYEVDDLEINDPDLEEIFLHFYQ